MASDIIAGVYRHHRGGLYLVLGLAWESTNGRLRKPVVLYFSLKKKTLNVRDAEEFFQDTYWDEDPAQSGPVRFLRIFPHRQPRRWLARSLGGSHGA